MNLIWMMPLATAVGAGLTALFIWVVIKIKEDR